MTELPTLEGRVMADLGHQVADLRAKLQQAEAERDHVAEQLGLVYWHITGGALSTPYDFKAVESQIDDHLNEFYGKEARDAEHRAAQAEAEIARLRTALEFVQRQLVASGWSASPGGCIARIDAALAETR